MEVTGDLEHLHDRIIACRRCPRLVRWREKTAREKVRRYAGEEYWGKPIPGFGDPDARLLLVGLAPAAHGGNRTGRMFTGDESGYWLIRALHAGGFANQATSMRRDDGLRLNDCYIAAAVRCAPPQNKPTAAEFATCRSFLLDEIGLLRRVRVIVGLGRIGFDAALEAFRSMGRITFTRRPRFAHGAEFRFGELTFIAMYHPSQQNTFTGRLTRSMLRRIFVRARKLLRHTRADTAYTASFHGREIPG